MSKGCALAVKAFQAILMHPYYHNAIRHPCLQQQGLGGSGEMVCGRAERTSSKTAAVKMIQQLKLHTTDDAITIMHLYECCITEADYMILKRAPII